MQTVRMKITATKEVPGIGKRIKAAREAVTKQGGRSLTDLASAAGISAAQWHRIEGEQIGTTLDTLRKIEAVLGVDLGVSNWD